MNLKKANKIVEKVTSKVLGLDFTFPMVNGHLEAKSSITMNGFDDDIYCQFRFYEDGLVSYCFTFDKLEESADVLQKINNFNKNVVFFKAYLEDGFLRIDHVCYEMSEKTLEEYTKGIFRQMIAEKTKEYLRPLTALTHS